MTIELIKTESVQMKINGQGTAVIIKDSSVTVGENKKVKNANGSLYNLAGTDYVGSYSYSLDGMGATAIPNRNVNIQNSAISLGAAGKDVDDYIAAIEAEQLKNTLSI